MALRCAGADVFAPCTGMEGVESGKRDGNLQVLGCCVGKGVVRVAGECSTSLESRERTAFRSGQGDGAVLHHPITPETIFSGLSPTVGGSSRPASTRRWITRPGAGDQGQVQDRIQP